MQQVEHIIYYEIRLFHNTTLLNEFRVTIKLHGKITLSSNYKLL